MTLRDAHREACTDGRLIRITGELGTYCGLWYEDHILSLVRDNPFQPVVVADEDERYMHIQAVRR